MDLNLTIRCSFLSLFDLRLTGGYAQMKHGSRAKELLVDRVIALFRQKILKPAQVECMPLADWRRGLEMYRASHTTKVLLTNYEEDVCL
jgi:hypothetical protein